MAAATLTFPSQTLLKNVVSPVDATDAATKQYVDSALSSGGTSIGASGSNTQIQFNSSGVLGANSNFTYDYANSILNVTGNIKSLNANLGNLVTSNYFVGTLTTASNAQPNITSVGTLVSLNVTGNISSGNANLGNLTTSNFFSGNGSLLSSITGANVTGQVNYAATANSVAGANVSGQVANALVAGTVYSNDQPNITSLGTLANLTVSGPVNLGSVANLSISGGTSGQFLGVNATGALAFTTLKSDSLFSGNSNVVVNPNANIVLSSNGIFGVMTISSNVVTITPTTDSTSVTTGALVVDGGVGIAGNLTIGGILNVVGDLSVGNLSTGGDITHTGNVTFSQPTIFSSTADSNSTTTGAIVVNGGVGVAGNIYGGNIISAATQLIRNNRNVPTYVASAIMPTNPLAGDQWYNTTNDRVYQYLYDGSSYFWVDISSSYVDADVNATPNSLVGRDANGNVTANTYIGNAISLTGNVTANSFVGNSISLNGSTIAVSSGTAGIFNLGVSNINIGLSSDNVTLGATSGNVIVRGKLVTSGLSISTTAIAVTTNTVLDSFAASAYRTAKYIISARNDLGYQSMEVLLVHDDMNSMITEYGVLSTATDEADLITVSTAISSGNVKVTANALAANTLVNITGTYIAD